MKQVRGEYPAITLPVEASKTSSETQKGWRRWKAQRRVRRARRLTTPERSAATRAHGTFLCICKERKPYKLSSQRKTMSVGWWRLTSRGDRFTINERTNSFCAPQTGTMFVSTLSTPTRLCAFPTPEHTHARPRARRSSSAARLVIKCKSAKNQILKGIWVVNAYQQLIKQTQNGYITLT